MFSKISIAALFAGLAAAYHQPVGDKPIGNAITRPLNEVVPACKAFTITWTPSTPNSVSLLLLKGPTENAVIFSVIKESIANSGSYTWQVPNGLEATSGPNGYGIQLIDDVTGQYQYSTQFGISNAGCGSISTPTATVSASVTGGGYSTNGPASSTKVSTKTVASSVYVTVTVSSAAASSSSKTSAAVGTGSPVPSSLVILPSNSMSIPSGLPSRTTTGVPSSSTTGPAQVSGNAASNVQAGLAFAGAFAGLAFLL